MDGTLLFREDFGGNDPSDPVVSTTPVPGMSSGYQQIYKLQTSDPGASMDAGRYLVAKRGYRNSTIPTYSVWHIMDDHTYFGDTTRGYFLEIDGRGSGNDVFYSTVIDGLCAGSKLSFSTYVANLTTAGQYAVWRTNRSYIHPKLSFVLTHPETGEELARYNTDTISHDWNNYPKSWRETADWQLVGMNFSVPEGINAVRLSIRNNASGSSTGNDFALDDIEVRLCVPPITIEGATEVCQNEAATLTVNFTNDGTFAEPLGYKWFFSADSVSWETLDETSNVLNISNVQKADSGWYKVAVSSEGNIENINCRAMSEPFRLRVNECAENLCFDGTLLFREDFGGNDPSDPAISMGSVPGMSSQYHNAGPSGPGSGRYTVRKEGWANGIQWHRQDDHTYPDDKTRGYLLEVDGKGGAEPFYSKTIDGLCAGSKLTFSAYVVNVHYAGQLDYFGSSYVFPRMKFVLKDPTTGTILAEKSTGDIQPDWRYGTPETWKYARDNALSAEWQLVGMNFIVPDGIESIQMFIYNDVERNGSGNDFALDDIEIHLCAPPVTIVGESEVCTNTATSLSANFTNDGTFAEPLAYKWWHSTDSVTWSEMSGFNGKILSLDAVQKTDSGWYKVAVSGDGNIESVNCRAVSEPFRLRVNECEPPEPPDPPTPPVPPCPEVLTVTADTTVCDTLMPFTWRGMVFEEAGEKRWMEKSPRDCDSIEHVYTLSTIHCEKPEPPQPADTLYEIIVNKYNWQLLCNNVALRGYFPGRTATAFQWYKDEQPIPGATGDDYSEHNELQGVFQLNVHLNDGRSIWSNIIEIDGPKEAPTRVQIYNSQGIPVSEGQVTRGVYLYRYEKGKEVWTEKKIVL